MIKKYSVSYEGRTFPFPQGALRDFEKNLIDREVILKNNMSKILLRDITLLITCWK